MIDLCVFPITNCILASLPAGPPPFPPPMMPGMPPSGMMPGMPPMPFPPPAMGMPPFGGVPIRFSPSSTSAPAGVVSATYATPTATFVPNYGGKPLGNIPGGVNLPRPLVMGVPGGVRPVNDSFNLNAMPQVGNLFQNQQMAIGKRAPMNLPFPSQDRIQLDNKADRRNSHDLDMRNSAGGERRDWSSGGGSEGILTALESLLLRKFSFIW